MTVLSLSAHPEGGGWGGGMGGGARFVYVCIFREGCSDSVVYRVRGQTFFAVLC